MRVSCVKLVISMNNAALFFLSSIGPGFCCLSQSTVLEFVSFCVMVFREMGAATLPSAYEGLKSERHFVSRVS
jgi:hypothetical protein